MRLKIIARSLLFLGFIFHLLKYIFIEASLRATGESLFYGIDVGHFLAVFIGEAFGTAFGLGLVYYFVEFWVGLYVNYIEPEGLSVPPRPKRSK